MLAHGNSKEEATLFRTPSQAKEKGLVQLGLEQEEETRGTIF
jgi:hypothetical protein